MCQNNERTFEYLKVVIYNKNKDVLYIKDFSRKNEAYELLNIYNEKTGLIEKSIIKNYELNVYYPDDEIVGYSCRISNEPVDSKIKSKYLTEYIYDNENKLKGSKTNLIQGLTNDIFEDSNQLFLNKIEEELNNKYKISYSEDNLPILISFIDNNIKYEKKCNNLIIDCLNLKNDYINEFDLIKNSFKYIKNYFEDKNVLEFINNSYNTYSSLDSYNSNNKEY